ncbi:MAG: ferredoxin family protein [Deltaproteobacteria bacterium]|nr:ferredoxin family protein [Deltaproteobacteria bacterium]
MTFVVTDNCQKCRFTDCVSVCPVDCFYGDAGQLYINPDECIDCGACEPECPVEAIKEESDLPAEQEQWIQINAEKSQHCENIVQKQDPLPTAEARKAELGF